MKYIITVFSFFLLFSCNSSKLTDEFNCEPITFSDLKTFTDYKKNFKIEIPKTWKTNYYYDNVISSIYSADTTLSLTQTILIDASFVLDAVELDENFIEKIKTDNTTMELKEVESKKTTFLDKSTYFNIAKGKKASHTYNVLNIFTKSDMGFLHIKTEIYGDSLVDERICKAVKLIDKIRFN